MDAEQGSPMGWSVNPDMAGLMKVDLARNDKGEAINVEGGIYIPSANQIHPTGRGDVYVFTSRGPTAEVDAPRYLQTSEKIQGPLSIT